MRKTGKLTIVLSVALSVWGLTGIYTDDEFSDNYWFIKHRPTWQFMFKPALNNGYSNEDVQSLSPSDLADHLRYKNFITNKKFEILIPQ